jgi:acetyl esterase/lipase
MTTASIELERYLDEEHLEALASFPRGALNLSNIEQAREGMAKRRASLPVVPLPDDVSLEDRYAPGPDGAPDLMVRLYRPATLPASAPAFYWVHGGGMVLGNVEMNDLYCAIIARQLNVLVTSVEYRLAPEHPFPAPVEDCYAGLKWLRFAADELGIDPGRIAIGGGSAGGGLAAGLALLARDRGEVDVCFQMLVFPMLDDRNATHSSQMVTDDRVWNLDSNIAGWNAYLDGRAGEDDVSPYAAPARATDLAGLPPAYINVGMLDLFRDEDIAYAQALMAAGVPVELHVYPGAFHGSPGMVPGAALSKRWSADERAALDRALNGAR